jgi:hypothetical protein
MQARYVPGMAPHQRVTNGLRSIELALLAESFRFFQKLARLASGAKL